MRTQTPASASTVGRYRRRLTGLLMLRCSLDACSKVKMNRKNDLREGSLSWLAWFSEVVI
jgi:hypothetical protein